MNTSFKFVLLSLVAAAWAAQAANFDWEVSPPAPSATPVAGGGRRLQVDTPKPLRIDGVAILALESASMTPSAAPSGTVRRLRGLLSAEPLDLEAAAAEAESNRQMALYDPRSLQDVGSVAPASGAGQGSFDLEAPLASTRTQTEGATGKSHTGYVFGIIVAVVCILAGFAVYIYCVKRRRRLQEKSVATTNKVLTTSISTQQEQPQPQPQQIAPSGAYGSPQLVN